MTRNRKQNSHGSGRRDKEILEPLPVPEGAMPEHIPWDRRTPKNTDGWPRDVETCKRATGYLLAGFGVRDAAEMVGITERTIHNWKTKWWWPEMIRAAGENNNLVKLLADAAVRRVVRDIHDDTNPAGSLAAMKVVERAVLPVAQAQEAGVVLRATLTVEQVGVEGALALIQAAAPAAAPKREDSFQRLDYEDAEYDDDLS